MTKFEQTETYRKLLGNPSDNVTVAFHVSTGIMVTEENVGELIAQEIAHYENKITEMAKYIPSLVKNADLEENISSRIRAFIGKELCIVEYAQFGTVDMLDAVREAEAREDFVEWLLN
jgi:hypothetical protein